jgi:hypothetical protein
MINYNIKSTHIYSTYATKRIILLHHPTPSTPIHPNRLEQPESPIDNNQLSHHQVQNYHQNPGCNRRKVVITGTLKRLLEEWVSEVQECMSGVY